MALPLEDYALVGDMQTAALVGRDGRVSWMCGPRFDSDAFFAELLGGTSHGHWQVAPARDSPDTPALLADRRYYDCHSMVLVQEWDMLSGGVVRVTDFMPLPRSDQRGTPQLVRVVRAVGGEAAVRSRWAPVPGYGLVPPNLRRCRLRHRYLTSAVAGPDAVWLDAPFPDADDTVFTLKDGQQVALTLTLQPSHRQIAPDVVTAGSALLETTRAWKQFADRCTYHGPHRETVLRSLLTLKMLTFAETGAMVASPTTSPLTQSGGSCSRDNRYARLRDGAMASATLLRTGYVVEALAWIEWLVRTCAADPENAQNMYGIDGRRHLPERELPFPGYESGVRVGNAAAGRHMLDVYGEVMDLLYQAVAHHNFHLTHEVQQLIRAVLASVTARWREPDQGLWEIPGPARHFVSSKIMMWVAADRAVRLCEDHKLAGPVDEWRKLRAQIHADVCNHGYDPDRNTFTQCYGSDKLDASLLRLLPMGFLPRDDKRAIGTVEAVQRELTLPGGLLKRYPTAGQQEGVDGLKGDEGAFLACTGWLAEALALIGRQDEADAVLTMLLDVRNDVGLLSEEYDTLRGRQVGHAAHAFPAFTMVDAITGRSTR